MSNVAQFAAETSSDRKVPAQHQSEAAVYTVAEVAKLLSLSLGGTYSLVRAGEIPGLKLGGRWVIPKKRFHAWLDDALNSEERTAGQR